MFDGAPSRGSQLTPTTETRPWTHDLAPGRPILLKDTTGLFCRAEGLPGRAAMLSTQSNGREPAVEVEPVQNFSLQGQGLLTVDGSARQQARTSSSTNSKPKAVLNPLAEAFSFGIEPDSPQIRPFYGTTADEAAGQTGNFVVPKIPSELEAPQAAEPQASDARAGGMLGFSPFSPGDEIFVPRTSSRGGQRPAPIAAHKAGYTGDGDVDVSSPRPTPATSGYQHMHQLYGQGNLPQTRAQYHPEQQQQASADASVNGLRSTPLRSPIVGGLVSSSANTAGSGDLPAWYTEDSYERSPNLGLRAGVAAPSFPSGRRTPEELNESMDQNSYAARGVSGWDRAAISRSGLGPSVNNRFAAPPPRVGPYGVGPTGLTAGPLNSRSSYGDELYSRYAAPSTSSRRGAEDDAMFLQMAREEQLALRNAAARRAVADEYFDPTRRLQSVQSGAIRGRSVEEELMLRQMEMQARQGIPRRPRYTPEPAPPGPAAYPNELAAFLQSTGRAQNKTWVETHGGDPSVFESRRPKIREDIAAGRFRTDLGAYPPGAGIPPRPAGGRVTPTMNHDEQLIFQQLSQLPPHQRQAALIRLAQQQRQAGDDRDLAARFGSLSFSSGSSGDTSSGPGGNVDVARYGLGIAGAVADGAPSKPSSSLRSISPPRSAVGSSPSTIRGDLSPKQASKGIVPPAKRANLDTLPHGVLLRILNYLKPGQYTFSDLDPPSPSPTRDLHALLRVSKRIHFATVPVLWSRLILRTDPHVRSCIASVARRVQWQGPGGSLAIWTRSIEVWGAVPAEVASALRVIVMEATREGNGGIRELALTCAPGMDEYILFRMFESTEPMKLETLRLRGPGVTDRMCSMIAMWARHVQRLEIISGTVTGE